MAREGVAALACSKVPDPEGVIIRGGEEPCAIGTDGTGGYWVDVTREDVAALACSKVPDPEGVIIRGGEKPCAIGTDGTAVYRIGMTNECSFQGIHW